jgi:antitoxin StbD
MTTISISQLKVNPSSVIAQAADYPVAVENRNKVQAYLMGKNLYERLMAFLEDAVDAAAIKRTDFSRGKDFEKVARDLGI